MEWGVGEGLCAALCVQFATLAAAEVHVDSCIVKGSCGSSG